MLVSGIKRRNETLYKVAKYIVDQQQDYFNIGSEGLKAMNMTDVAQALDYHESTISRITSEKYVVTPYGVLELKYFFPSSIKTVTGETKSSVSAKEAIKKLVNNERPNQAHSDEKLAELMMDLGINISRRTVAKYREEMNIPSSYSRANVNLLKKEVVCENLEPELE